jgi:hypothetical protein
MGFAGWLLAACVCAQPFIIGVEENEYFPHYAYIDGQYRGFGRELLDAFFTAKGYQYQYRALPGLRLFESFLIEQNVDFKYPDNASWSTLLRQGREVVYSEPVMALTNGVSVLPENKGLGIGHIQRLATVRGFSLPQWNSYIQQGDVALSENPSLIRLIEQTLIGRVDGAYASIDVVQYLLENELNRPGALQFDESLPHDRTHYHLSSIKHPQVIAEFNQWMQENAALVDSIKRKFTLDTDD